MPKKATVPCPAGSPTRLTDAAVTAARVVGTRDFCLCARLDATPPASTDGAVMLLPWSVLAAELDLVNLFPDVGASLHLSAWPISDGADVSISHASGADARLISFRLCN